MSHYQVKSIISFPSESSARDYAEKQGLSHTYWRVSQCHCDNPTRAEKLAMYYPRLFGWLIKRELGETYYETSIG